MSADDVSLNERSLSECMEFVRRTYDEWPVTPCLSVTRNGRVRLEWREEPCLTSVEFNADSTVSIVEFDPGRPPTMRRVALSEASPDWRFDRKAKEARARIAELEAAVKAKDAEIARLADQIETERIRLAGCGVVAMSNTEESLGRVLDNMATIYDSASLRDVERAVRMEIAQRKRIAALEDALNPQDVSDVDAALRRAEMSE